MRGEKIMPDAKEWEKASLNLVKTKSWLFKFHDEYEQDFEINEDIVIIRHLLNQCITIMDKLAKWDDKGWFKSTFEDD